MHPGILTRHVDVEVVVSMFDHGDAQSLLTQIGNDARYQGRLPRAAPSRYADHLHFYAPEPAVSAGHLDGKALYRRRPNVMRTSRNGEDRQSGGWRHWMEASSRRERR